MRSFILTVFLFTTLSCDAIKNVIGDEAGVDENFSTGSDCENCSSDDSSTDGDSGSAAPTPTCPTNYIKVSGNGSLGTDDFCVAKFEMRNVSGVATSQSANSPWVSIDAYTAKAECQNLGTDYDLISNPEWLTIAYEIEQNSSNWSGGSVGNGMIPRGHSDNTPSSALDISSTSDLYDQTGNTAGDAVGGGWEQKRVHYLSDSSEIWDFSGNVAEWVDWNIGGSFDLAPTTCPSGFVEFSGVSCGALSSSDYSPVNAAYGSSEGLGKFNGGTGGAAQRGGVYNSTMVRYGIYGLILASTPASNSINRGFRCVYRL